MVQNMSYTGRQASVTEKSSGGRRILLPSSMADFFFIFRPFFQKVHCFVNKEVHVFDSPACAVLSNAFLKKPFEILFLPTGLLVFTWTRLTSSSEF